MYYENKICVTFSLENVNKLPVTFSLYVFLIVVINIFFSLKKQGQLFLCKKKTPEIFITSTLGNKTALKLHKLDAFFWVLTPLLFDAIFKEFFLVHFRSFCMRMYSQGLKLHTTTTLLFLLHSILSLLMGLLWLYVCTRLSPAPTFSKGLVYVCVL